MDKILFLGKNYRWCLLPMARSSALVRCRLLAIWLLLALGAVGQAEVVISSQGQPAAAIVSNGHHAQAEELALYLKAITGANIPVIEEIPIGEQPLVVLEVAETIAGTSDTPRGEQAYRIHTEGNRLTLTGRSARGLTYAVYGLLEDHLGLRFFADVPNHPANFPTPNDVPLGKVEVIPENQNLVIGKIDDTQEPAFSFRGFIWNTEGVDHEIKNRGHGVPDTISSHSFYQYIPPDKYFDDHPEWFPLIDGERKQHHFMAFCYTNEALAQELADRVMEKMAQWEDLALPIPVGQGDGFRACECQVCRQVVAKEGSEMGPVLLLLNRVLEKTSERFPDHQIITFAYFNTLKPPQNLRPHPNLWINIASSALNQTLAGDQLGRIRNNPRNADIAEAIEEWPKIAPGRVVVWEWANQFFQPLMEWPQLLNVVDNIRFYAENNVDVVKLQICLGNGNWGRLRRWLWLKMMWNPDQDEEELANEFLSGYYGTLAGPILWKYIQYVHQVVKESGYQSSVCRGASFSHCQAGLLFNKENLEQMTKYIVAAEAAAAAESNPVFAQRVARIRGATIDDFEMPDHKDVVLAKTKDPRDGSLWLVPDGRPDHPARLDRLKSAYGNLSGGGGHPWFYQWLSRKILGASPIVQLENDLLVCDVAPDRHAQITSLVYKPTGTELVTLGIGTTTDFGTAAGYEDIIAGNNIQCWTVVSANSKELDLEANIQFHAWEYYDNMRLSRRIRLDDDTACLHIERKYQNLEGHKRIPDSLRFSSHWSFLIPQWEDASLEITGGGLRETFPVQGKEVQSMPLDQSADDLKVTIDRGDGLFLLLTAPAKGFDMVTLQPDAEHRCLILELRGISHSTGQEALEIDLPPVTLRVDERDH